VAELMFNPVDILLDDENVFVIDRLIFILFELWA
jgi:hypothetical protein